MIASPQTTLSLIDSHCHLDQAAFDGDRAQVIAHAEQAGIQHIIVPAIEYVQWAKVAEICSSHPNVHAAYGLHPMWEPSHQDEHIKQLHTWIDAHPCVAIGECGLDFHVDGLDANRQIALFEAQVALANDTGLPLIIHARKATEQVLLTLKKYPNTRGIIHSYSGSLVQAQQLCEMGFLIGLGGVLTLERAKKVRHIAQNMPLEAILLESDAPDQPPASYRAAGNTRNEPASVAEVFDALTKLRPETPEQIAEQLQQNAKDLFGIG